VATSDPNARLERILDAHALLAKVAADLGPDLDVDEVLATVLSAMRKLVDFRGGSVQLVDEHGVYVAASDPPVSPEVAALRVKVGDGLSGRVVATGQPIRSDDIRHDDRVSASVSTTGSNAGIASYMAVPLVCLGEVIGALQIDSPVIAAFDEDDETLMEGLAAQVAGVIESARRFALVMELERLKSDFLARVSHELRTPITIIDGFVLTLFERDEHIDAATRHDMLDRCRVASARLAGLIEDLITLSRLQTGVISGHPVRTMLRPLLEAVAGASASPALVTIECDDDASVLIDADLLRRALSFLVDNALKYGGEATISLVEDGRVINVSDPGPGIPEDVRSSVFELFTRGRATTNVPGLGLGLPIARTLLVATGAELEVTDGEPSGTVVRITLPTW
jgi:signal transduction histidine kinase